MLVCDRLTVSVLSAVAIILLSFSLRNLWPSRKQIRSRCLHRRRCGLLPYCGFLFQERSQKDSRFRSVYDGINTWLNCSGLPAFYDQVACSCVWVLLPGIGLDDEVAKDLVGLDCLLRQVILFYEDRSNSQGMWYNVYLKSQLIQFIRVVDAFYCINVLSMLSLKENTFSLPEVISTPAAQVQVCVDL